jgi:hypothetical protein
VTERGTARLGPVTADRAGRVTAVFDPIATTAAVVGAQLTVGPTTGAASASGPVALTP